MKTFKKALATTAVLSLMLSLFGVFGPTGSNVTYAATDPGLGAAETFSIIAQTSITGTGTISGDVGINSTGAGITALTAGMVGGTIYSTDGVAPSVATPFLDPDVQANLSSANDDISLQGSTDSIGPVLDGEILTTGVYDIGAGRLNGGVLTLDGPGIYILRASSDLVSSGSIDLINGARACDVYWQVNTLATINGSEFTGTIIAGTGVHFGDGVALDGRALALGGDVTLINNTISGPTCVEPGGSGGNSLPAPPLIDVVKVPTPLSLPNGPGVVTYTYTLKNIGTVAVNYVTMVDDTCSPIVLISGDTNSDAKLDLNETWEYTCSTTLTKTHTNTVVATGLANATSAVDIASATVVVGIPVVPPLIHITKVPSPLILPSGGGMITYTKTVTNPGTIPLSNVVVTDSKCSPIQYISGDTNNDSKLDTTESWKYTCKTNLSQTTTNTAVATGEANGLTARDFAIATVVVPATPAVPTFVPGLPAAGFAP